MNGASNRKPISVAPTGGVEGTDKGTRARFYCAGGPRDDHARYLERHSMVEETDVRGRIDSTAAWTPMFALAERLGHQNRDHAVLEPP